MDSNVISIKWRGIRHPRLECITNRIRHDRYDGRYLSDEEVSFMEDLLHPLWSVSSASDSYEDYLRHFRAVRIAIYERGWHKARSELLGDGFVQKLIHWLNVQNVKVLRRRRAQGEEWKDTTHLVVIAERFAAWILIPADIDRLEHKDRAMHSPVIRLPGGPHLRLVKS